MKIAVCDDDAADLKLLLGYCAQYDPKIPAGPGSRLLCSLLRASTTRCAAMVSPCGICQSQSLMKPFQML